MAGVFHPITEKTDLPVSKFGLRAHQMGALKRAEFSMRPAFALNMRAISTFADGELELEWPLDSNGALYALRSSVFARDWGGPETILYLGFGQDAFARYAKEWGVDRANALRFRAIEEFAVKVARLDMDDFENLRVDHTRDGKTDYAAAVDAALAWYEEELEEVFPQDPQDQLTQAARSMVKMWNGTTARILRTARGAPSDAGLALVMQEMVIGTGQGECGMGEGQMVWPTTGAEEAHGRYYPSGKMFEPTADDFEGLFLSQDPRGASMEDRSPQALIGFKEALAQARVAFRDDMRLTFTVQDDVVWVVDVTPAERAGRATIASFVRLVSDGIKSREEALLGLDPRNLNEVLHPLIDPKATRKVFATGIGASPGAATGKIVFSANAAQVSAARSEACILVRVETTPEDIRGMHSAQGVLTERGGITSHAAVVARGLGLPCVVGADGIRIDSKSGTLVLENGEVLREGDTITLDGATGEALFGAPRLVEPDLGGPFDTFMSWADEVRKLEVRANADTPHDARLAVNFGVDGIGLCRTEHMFFDGTRLSVMRELIFADGPHARRDALNQLMPMQQADFEELFEIMDGAPVCIRLLDPPLHEFLPRSVDEISTVAQELGLTVPEVKTRIDELSEFNPMLGMRGVRLGLTFPEIYDMQARAIFLAAANVQKKTKKRLRPEIMVPLVSANREVELVKERVEAVAANVASETGQDMDYDLGVMVETPRAALRAGEISQSSAFFSFGTNDLTQMTYGLSRDDAGRFMRDYVSHDVYPEDPFHTLDTEGVGELILHAVDRGRKANANLKIGLCGEHGGDPVSVAFCYNAKFDYVSCSPFRTPIARLSAAQAALLNIKS